MSEEKIKFTNVILRNPETGEVENPICKTCGRYESTVFTRTERKYVCLYCYSVFRTVEQHLNYIDKDGQEVNTKFEF